LYIIVSMVYRFLTSVCVSIYIYNSVVFSVPSLLQKLAASYKTLYKSHNALT